MDRDFRLTLPVPPPTPDERAALRLAGAYCARAWQVTAHRLLAEHVDDSPKALTRLTVALLTSARLCDELALVALSDRPR